jgi:hypothetical protein
MGNMLLTESKQDDCLTTSSLVRRVADIEYASIPYISRRLPRAIMGYITVWLSIRDYAKWLLVCRYWYHASRTPEYHPRLLLTASQVCVPTMCLVATMRPSWLHLNISKGSDLPLPSKPNDDPTSTLSSSMPLEPNEFSNLNVSLRHLTWTAFLWEDTGSSWYIHHLTSLTSLRLSAYAPSLSTIKSLVHLQRLHLHECDSIEGVIECIPSSLLHLVIDRPEWHGVTSKQIHRLSSASPVLQSLRLRDNPSPSIEKRQFDPINQTAGADSIHIQIILAGAPNLTRLDVPYWRVSRKSFGIGEEQEHFDIVEYSGIQSLSMLIDDYFRIEQLMALIPKMFPNLTSISFRCAQYLSSDALNNLCTNLPRLRHIRRLEHFILQKQLVPVTDWAKHWSAITSLSSSTRPLRRLILHSVQSSWLNNDYASSSTSSSTSPTTTDKSSILGIAFKKKAPPSSSALKVPSPLPAWLMINGLHTLQFHLNSGDYHHPRVHLHISSGQLLELLPLLRSKGIEVFAPTSQPLLQWMTWWPFPIGNNLVARDRKVSDKDKAHNDKTILNNQVFLKFLGWTARCYTEWKDLGGGRGGVIDNGMTPRPVTVSSAKVGTITKPFRGAIPIACPPPNGGVTVVSIIPSPSHDMVVLLLSLGLILLPHLQ